MANTLTVPEALKATELAAERFYRTRALLSRDQEARSLFATLADDESRHAALALGLGDDPAAANAQVQPTSDLGRLLGAFVKRTESMDQRLHNLGTERDLLDLALEHEKDSVLLYATLGPRLGSASLRLQFDKARADEARHFDRLWALRSSWVHWSRLQGPSDAALEVAMNDLKSRVSRPGPRPPGRVARRRESRVET